MRRQTSERLEEISCAILVPLTTTVACSMNSRTMRPSRTSVACARDSPAFAGMGARVTRVVEGLLIPELCGSAEKSTNNRTYLSGAKVRTQAGDTRTLISTAWGEWVSRPTEI